MECSGNYIYQTEYVDGLYYIIFDINCKHHD